MKKTLTIAFSALFLSAGLIPAKALHYCRMLDRITENDCGICHAPVPAVSPERDCCADKMVKGDAPETCSSDVAAPECCSLLIQDPFAAAAAGATTGITVSPTLHDGAMFAAMPSARLSDPGDSYQTEITCDIVAPAIVTPPARITGGGFLC
ncbi:MAG: hypothetical protein AB1752_04820 [Candidatus Zixiibacteriota bacterium]